MVVWVQISTIFDPRSAPIFSHFFADTRALMKTKVQIGVKFGDFFSHKNQTMPTVGWIFYCGTPLTARYTTTFQQFGYRLISIFQEKTEKTISGIFETLGV